jgi:hypothetical protein
MDHANLLVIRAPSTVLNPTLDRRPRASDDTNPRPAVDWNGSCAQIVLKNSEIGPPRKSRFRGRRVISADSPGGRAYRSVAHGKTGRSADPLGNFSSRPPAVF